MSIQGDLFEGTEVRGREEGGWLRLDAVPRLRIRRLEQVQVLSRTDRSNCKADTDN